MHDNYPGAGHAPPVYETGNQASLGELAAQTPEDQAYMQELIRRITAESVGSVGIDSYADLSPQDRQAMAAAQAGRNNGVKPGQYTGSSHGGYSDFGEQPISDTNIDPVKNIDAAPSRDHEQVSFIESDDGSTYVRYRFGANGWIDSSGRPGKHLAVGFKLSRNTANTLRDAVADDPRQILAVVKSQLGAVGVSEDSWKKNFEPQTGFKDYKTLDQRSLTIKTFEPGGDHDGYDASYATRYPIAQDDAAEQYATKSPSGEVEAEAPNVWQDAVSESTRRFEAGERIGLSFDVVLDGLAQETAELVATNNVRSETPGHDAAVVEAANAEAYGNTEAATLKLAERLQQPDGAQYMEQSMLKLAARYAADARKNGTSQTEVPDVYDSRVATDRTVMALKMSIAIDAAAVANLQLAAQNRPPVNFNQEWCDYYLATAVADDT